MTLVYPEWLLTIENLTAGWKFDTYEGEEADPDAPAALLDDGFRFSWTFRDGLTPNVRDPETLGFKFTCQSPADMPACRQGDQLVMRLQRPPGVVSRDGSGVLVGAGVTGAIDIVWQGFRIRTTAAQYSLGTKQVILAVAATDYMADLNPSIDMTYGGDNFQQYDTERVNWETVYGRPLSVIGPMVRDNTTVSVYMRGALFTPILGEVAIRYGGDSNSPRELQIIEALNKWTLGQRFDTMNPANGVVDTAFGWAGEDVAVMVIPMVVGELAMYPFPALFNDQVFRTALGNDRSGLLYMASWGPYTELDTPPYELALVGGDLASVRAAGVEFHDNEDLLIIDGANVHAAPEWKSTRENAVNTWRFLGLSVDQGADNQVEEFTITDDPAIIRNGPVSRTIETMLVANVYAGSGLEGLNGKAPDAVPLNYKNLRALEANFRDTIPTASGDWSPEGFTLHPRSLTDDAWDAYAGRWHPTGKMQQAIALVGIEDDQNLAGPDTPIFQTMTGCDIRLSRGHLYIEPRARPMKMKFTGGAVATFADVQATYPTVNLSDIAPGFTFGQARLTAP